jgi:hypothetical protein
VDLEQATSVCWQRSYEAGSSSMRGVAHVGWAPTQKNGPCGLFSKDSNWSGALGPFFMPAKDCRRQMEQGRRRSQRSKGAAGAKGASAPLAPRRKVVTCAKEQWPRRCQGATTSPMPQEQGRHRRCPRSKAIAAGAPGERSSSLVLSTVLLLSADASRVPSPPVI